MENYSNIAVVILAGGKGRRMPSENKNKVTHELDNQPIILRIVKMFQSLNLEAIVVVVGYAKESVVAALKGAKVIFANQQQQLGTGHAVKVGLEKVPVDISDIIVIYGDDASLYPSTLLEKLISQHRQENNAITFLSFEVDDPTALGRVIRENGKVLGIVEEKNATTEQRKIKEINPGLYIFKKNFLQEYLPVIQINSITKEYYLTDLVEIAVKNNLLVNVLKGGQIPWIGINSFADLEKAQLIYNKQI